VKQCTANPARINDMIIAFEYLEGFASAPFIITVLPFSRIDGGNKKAAIQQAASYMPNTEWRLLLDSVAGLPG
jgi:hypothetical protein